MLGFALENLGYTLMVVVGVGLLIFVHELGHFLAAKAAGVRVEAFSLGFGRPLVAWRRGETEYRLSVVPIGGYVKMSGEDPAEGGSDPRSLQNRSIPWRFLIFSGGVLMNLLFALVAFPLVFSWGVPFVAPVAGAVEPGSPAWVAGLEEGDRILQVQGRRAYSFDQIAMEAALTGEEGLDLLVERRGRKLWLKAHPRYVEGRGVQLLGVARPLAAEARIVLLDPEGPAAQAGLRDGDRLIAVDGRPYDHRLWNELERKLSFEPEVWDGGKKLRLTVERDGRKLVLTLVPRISTGQARLLGVRAPLAAVAGLRFAHGLDGLAAGDVLLAVRGGGERQEILGAEDLDRALAAAGPDAVLLAARHGPDHGPPRFLEIRVPAHLRGPAHAKSWRKVLALGADTKSGRVLVQRGGAAWRAGLRSGDRILSYGGREIRRFDDLRQAVAEAGERALPLRWLPAGGGAPKQALVRPSPARRVDLGFALQVADLRETYRVPGLLPSLKAGAACSIDTIRQLYVTLKRILGGTVSSRKLGGIITISVMTYQTARSGFPYFLYFLAILSLNLAFLNVLPIPVLDGGHLMFLLLEAVKGSPVSARVHTWAQIVGLALVLALMVFVTINDVIRLFG